MTARISLAHAEARLAATRDALDTGTDVGKIQIWTSPRVAAVGDVPSGTLLAEIELDKPCCTISGGVATLIIPMETVAIGAGVATWAYWVDGDDVPVMDTDVSTMAGTAEVRISSTTLSIGTTVEVLSATIG